MLGGTAAAVSAGMITLDADTLHNVTGAGPIARRAGEAFGFGAGVAVTGALAFVPGWNDQVAGQPPGFQRRHESVVGPQITEHARGLPAGGWRDFVGGVGAGATAAPPWSFQHGI